MIEEVVQMVSLSQRRTWCYDRVRSCTIVTLGGVKGLHLLHLNALKVHARQLAALTKER